VYGTPDPRSGAAGSAMNVTGFPGMLHRVEVKAGVLGEDCLHVLQAFFAAQRKNEKKP